MGGDIRIDDAPEGGARFRVHLPLRAPEGVPVLPPRDLEVPASSPASAFSLPASESHPEAAPELQDGLMAPKQNR